MEKGERRLKSHQTRQYHQFCAEKFDAFLKKTWTWEICFPTVEKNHRSKQNLAETCNQGGWVLRSSWKNIRETRWQFSWRDPGFVVSTVNCLSTICVLSWLFLSQAIFPFHSFCFHNFSPPLRTILAVPLRESNCDVAYSSNMFSACLLSHNNGVFLSMCVWCVAWYLTSDSFEVPVLEVCCIVLCNVFTLTCKTLDYKHASQKREKQIHERRRGYIHCGSIEYTLDGANAFPLFW